MNASMDIEKSAIGYGKQARLSQFEISVPLGLKMKRIARKVQFYLWCLYWNFLLMAILVPRTIFDAPTIYYRGINWLSYIWLFLILKVVFENFKALFYSCYLRNRVFKVYKPLLLIIGMGVITGFFFSSNRFEFYRPLVWDFLPMFCIAFGVLAGAGGAFRERFMRMIGWQSIISGGFTLWVLISFPVTSRNDFTSVHYAASNLLWPCILAVASLKSYSSKLQIGVVISFLVWLLLAISYQSRGGAFMAFILLPSLLLIIAIRNGSFQMFGLKGFLAVTALGIGIYFLIAIPETRSQIASGYAGTITRLYGGANETNILLGLRESLSDEFRRSRGAEAKDFISSAGILTWFVGKGYGAGWQSEVMGSSNWGIVHFGPLHLILKGGVLLSLLFLVLMFESIKRAWKSIKIDPLAGSFLCGLVLYFVSFLKHGPAGHGYSIYIVWLVVGMSLASPGTEHYRARRSLERKMAGNE